MTNETIIENEHCDIFPNQISIEKASLIKIMEKKKVCKNNLMPLRMKKIKLKKIYKNYICKEKNGEGMIGMHCVGHFTL